MLGIGSGHSHNLCNGNVCNKNRMMVHRKRGYLQLYRNGHRCHVGQVGVVTPVLFRDRQLRSGVAEVAQSVTGTAMTCIVSAMDSATNDNF